MHSKGEAQKRSIFSVDFLAFFVLSQERLLSRNSTRKPLNLEINHRFLQTPLVNPLVSAIPLVCTLLIMSKSNIRRCPSMHGSSLWKCQFSVESHSIPRLISRHLRQRKTEKHFTPHFCRVAALTISSLWINYQRTMTTCVGSLLGGILGHCHRHFWPNFLPDTEILKEKSKAHWTITKKRGLEEIHRTMMWIVWDICR